MKELREAIEEDLTRFLDDLVEKTEARREKMRLINEMLRPGIRKMYEEMYDDIYKNSFCSHSI